MMRVKILSYKSPQRYAVNRTVQAAWNDLRKTRPDLELVITQVKTLDEMLTYTQVVILPSLVVNEELVCVGRFPKKRRSDPMAARSSRLIF
ncbi:MAG TPA: thioredoxin family protein [Anaerolineales bacterium]|nr:thioredoxin family protein [Anaerolineales bacterium]